MKNLIALMGLSLLTPALGLFGQEGAPSDMALTEVDTLRYGDLPYWRAPPVLAYDDAWYLFEAGETQIGIGYAVTDHHDENDSTAGFYLNGYHYFSRYLALGADYLFTGNDGHENVVTANAKLRIPFDEASFAFVFAVGGGGCFGGQEGTAGCLNIGAGLEVRLLEALSLCADFRVMETTSETDFYGLQLGLCFPF